MFCGTCILVRLLPIIKIKPLNADYVKKKKIEIWIQIQKENEVKRERRIEHLFTNVYKRCNDFDKFVKKSLSSSN